MTKTAKTDRLEARATPETVERAGDLAKAWGGIRALPISDVIAEAIRRAWEAEAKAGKGGSVR
jgi:hypothetical protein